MLSKGLLSTAPNIFTRSGAGAGAYSFAHFLLHYVPTFQLPQNSTPYMEIY